MSDDKRSMDEVVSDIDDCLSRRVRLAEDIGLLGDAINSLDGPESISSVVIRGATTFMFRGQCEQDALITLLGKIQQSRISELERLNDSLRSLAKQL